MGDFYTALSALIGGAAGALDKIDGAGLSDGDAAVVVLSTGVYHYHLNASSGATENSPFRIVPDANAGTKVWHLVGTSAKIGALIKLTANESIADSTQVAIPWDAETYNIGGFWVIGAPTRFTIPIGVTDIIIKAGVRYAVNGSGDRSAYIFKNGGSMPGRPHLTIPTPTINTNFILTSPKLSVSATDYFELNVYQTSGGSLNVETHDSTWFSIEAVGFA